MPNTREKLIELLCDVIETDGCSGHCNFPPCYLVKACADNLIANGVTVQGDKDNNVPNKWISVKDRLPKPFTPVLVYRQSFGTLPPYIKVDKMILWNDDTQVWTDEVGNWKNVTTHWMPLPEPPKTSE